MKFAIMGLQTLTAIADLTADPADLVLQLGLPTAHPVIARPRDLQAMQITYTRDLSDLQGVYR